MVQPLHILVIADDDAEVTPFLQQLDMAGYAPHATRVASEPVLRATLGTEPWDVVLCSNSLAQLDVATAVKVLYEHDIIAPTIMFSHAGGEEAAVAALKAGAHNFVSANQIERFVPVLEQEFYESRALHVLGRHDEEMRSVLAHAQCLLWSGLVIDPLHPSNLMEWYTEVFDEGAAQRFAPIECAPGERFTAAWYRHRLPDDQIRTDQLSTTALRNNHEQYTETFRCRLRDGTVHWYSEQVRVTPLSPRSWRVVGVAVDITERKQAEARLAFVAEASALLTQSLDRDTIFDRLSKLCVPFLADMCIVDICEDDGSLRRVASHHVDPRKAELARELEQRYPLDPQGTHPAVQVIRTGEPIFTAKADLAVVFQSTYDAEHQAIVEQLTFKSFLVVPLKARNQTLGAISLVATEAQRAYGHADLALAQEIAHRATIAAENANLYERAQQAIRLREAFLSIAAHELRTPLTALLGNAQVLERRSARDTAFVERDQRNLSAIIAQGNRLNRLIELLLDVSRLQQDRLQLDLQPVDMSMVVDRVVSEIVPALSEHELRVEVESGVLVLGDELRLEQVLHNLLGNAVKYSPQASPITIRLSKNADGARLAVIDQGIGIPAHEQSQVFEQFFRASNINAKRISGLGVGLYLVYEVITRHGGSVAVESTEGRGSTFTIVLPLLKRSPMESV